MSNHISQMIKNVISQRLKLEKYLKEHPCETCVYSKSISNKTPCLKCRNNNLYEEDLEGWPKDD